MERGNIRLVRGSDWDYEGTIAPFAPTSDAFDKLTTS